MLLIQLIKGDHIEGWQLYEWEWKSDARKPLRYLQPTLWLGQESINGKSLLIYAEQGLGDSLQFIRYALLAERLGADVILELPSALTGIAATLKGRFCLASITLTGSRQLSCPVSG